MLPWAHGYFDAALSVTSYSYFGTNEIYLGYLSQFVRPHGTLAIAVAGCHDELDEPPDHLTRTDDRERTFWAWDYGFHSAAWWERMWRRIPWLDDVHAEPMPDGGHVWAAFERAKQAHHG